MVAATDSKSVPIRGAGSIPAGGTKTDRADSRKHKTRVMKKVKTYKVELFDGPMNGAIRYYDSLSTAKRVARSYVTRNRDYPENVGFWISEVYEDFTTRCIISE